MQQSFDGAPLFVSQLRTNSALVASLCIYCASTCTVQSYVRVTVARTRTCRHSCLFTGHTSSQTFCTINLHPDSTSSVPFRSVHFSSVHFTSLHFTSVLLSRAFQLVRASVCSIARSSSHTASIMWLFTTLRRGTFLMRLLSTSEIHISRGFGT